MRDYEDVKAELQRTEEALKDEEGSGSADVEQLRERTAALRVELYEHPQHPADTQGEVTGDDGTYPERRA
ncbi:MAG: hypothetical protein LC789_02115 [Actinobacteria bacterium]|nr:hypothetical protein [Actinomycetota bacterium]MCA1721358.1 hypothetical protein [Actinomycetota bacterium]